jgi:hypothetical protein
MKLRIQADGIRIRLDQDQVRQLADGQRLEQRLEIGPQVFTCTLQAADDVPVLGAAFDQGHLKILAPIAQVKAWLESAQTGMEVSQPTGPGPALHLVVERDLMPRRKRD